MAKAKSPMHESHIRTSIKNDSISSIKQDDDATQKQQHTRPANKGTMLDFLKPSSNKTKVKPAFMATTMNTVHTCTDNTKQKSCENEPHLTQCSNKQQTINAQEVTGRRRKAEGILSDRYDRYEELRLMTWNVMGTTTILDELQTLTQENKPCIDCPTSDKAQQAGAG